MHVFLNHCEFNQTNNLHKQFNIYCLYIIPLIVYCSQSKHLLSNSRSLLHLSIEYFVIVHDNDTPKAKFVSPMSERTYTWAAQSIPDNRLPTSPSFFFSFLSFYDNAGEWIDVRGAVFTQPHPIVRSGRRMARPECPSALPRRIRRCGSTHDTIAFHFVTCLSRSWLVERLPVDLTLCINERTTNVRRE